MVSVKQTTNKPEAQPKLRPTAEEMVKMNFENLRKDIRNIFFRSNKSFKELISEVAYPESFTDEEYQVFLKTAETGFGHTNFQIKKIIEDPESRFIQILNAFVEGWNEYIRTFSQNYTGFMFAASDINEDIEASIQDINYLLNYCDLFSEQEKNNLNSLVQSGIEVEIYPSGATEKYVLNESLNEYIKQIKAKVNTGLESEESINEVVTKFSNLLDEHTDSLNKLNTKINKLNTILNIPSDSNENEPSSKLKKVIKSYIFDFIEYGMRLNKNSEEYLLLQSLLNYTTV